MWELTLSWWRVIRLRRLVFLISCKATGKQMIVYHSELTVLHCSSGTIAICPVFPKKLAIIFLGSASCASNFCWIWPILKDPHSRLLFTFGLIRLNPQFIICHDVIDVFRSTAIVFLEHFFPPIDMNLFLSNWQIVWNLTRTNFFSRSNVHAILNVCLMPKVVSI